MLPRGAAGSACICCPAGFKHHLNRINAVLHMPARCLPSRCSTVELYNPQRDCWEAGPLMPAACSFAAGAMLGRDCLVVEGTAHAPAVLALDRHARRWRHCRGLATPRVNMAVAALEEKLFVLVRRRAAGCTRARGVGCDVQGARHQSLLGPRRQHSARAARRIRCLPTGPTNLQDCRARLPLSAAQGGRAGIGKGAAVLREVEIFCPATNTWHAAPGMALPRASLAAAALGGRLYAVGGQDGRATHASAEVFDPGAGRWLALGAPLHHPRKYLGLAAAGGRLVAVGGMSGARLRLGGAEALDPREGRWQALPPMACPRSSAGVAALHGCVYVVGGNVGEDIMQACGGGGGGACQGARYPGRGFAGCRQRLAQPLPSPGGVPSRASRALPCRRTTPAWRCGCLRRDAGGPAPRSATAAAAWLWPPSEPQARGALVDVFSCCMPCCPLPCVY
jgi:hypothetical protein